MTTPYVRPNLTEEEQKNVAKLAARLNAQPKPQVFLTLIALVAENATLVKELNQHRATLGYEPLPTHKAEL